MIFDFDGVLIDSHDAHRDSWFLLAEELGEPLTEAQFAESFGMRNETIIPGVFGWAEEGDTETVRALADRKEHCYRKMLRRDGLKPLPGVSALLDSLDAAAIPFAIGSSTQLKNIETALALCGLEDRFNAIAAAEDVHKGKPDPAVFLCAADRLNCPPERCLVFEDAHVGIDAARAGGMKCIAVTTTHARETFGDTADRIIDSLDEVSADDIVRLLS